VRIHGIEAIPVDIPLSRNFGGSTYAVLKRSTVITRMRTDDGLVSQVYNGDNREHGPEIVRLIHEELAPLARGQSIFEGERIWEAMFALSHRSRDRKTLMEAIACVDCARWDLVGKALGRSVGELLGGYRAALPIISIGGYYLEGKTLADIGREMEAYRRAGMAGCKFKVGGLAPEQDAERVAAARRAAGPDFVLAVDANRGWSVQDAVRFARLVEPLGIRWFEEPCAWYDDAAMMARVRVATRIPSPPASRRSPATGCAGSWMPAPSISSTSMPRRAAASPSGAGRRRCAGWSECRWHTTRSRRSPSTSWPPCPTAPTWSASPIPSAIPSGRRCGATGRRSGTG
jgi:L-alanine-DL-glutamate epimerase-like enolase superfamily enzyme